MSLSCFLVTLCLLFFTLITTASAQAATSHFPLYPVIRNNVYFWEQIYSTHSINTAVLHDKHNLHIVYATIKLKDSTYRNAEKLNKKKLASAKKKYKNILTKLARGESARYGQMKRVKALFPKDAGKKDFQNAIDSIRVQTGLKERFKEGVVRSGAYMAEIKTIFRAYGLPEDLAYLPHVESSFNVKAYSKYGAAGIWQFTRSTGKQYMRITDAIDERRDPIIAAHAAAKFLKDNHKDLGNWPLAITAYNYGKAGMMRAKKAEGSYENIFLSYNEGHFKFASENFYSEFLAAVYVAKKLEQSKKLKLDRPANAYSVRLPAYASYQKLSRHLKVRESDIKKLNPALLSSVYAGEKYIPKGYHLRLPANKVNRTAVKNMPQSFFSPTQKRSLTYKVRSGDTVSQIAAKHKVSTKKLIAKNNLNKNAHVYVGQILKIPQTYNPSKSNKSIKTIRATKKKNLLSNTLRTPMNDPVKLSVGNIYAKQGVVYGEIIAQSGESISLFAKWLNTTEQHLRKINKMGSSHRIKPGQIVTLSFATTSRFEFERIRNQFH